MNIRFVNIPTTNTILAWGGIALFGAVMVLLFFQPVPQGNKDTLNLAIGGLMGWVGATFAFYFGDSKKAQAQAETINTMATTAATGTGGAGPAPGTTTLTATVTPGSDKERDDAGR